MNDSCPVNAVSSKHAQVQSPLQKCMSSMRPGCLKTYSALHMLFQAGGRNFRHSAGVFQAGGKNFRHCRRPCGAVRCVCCRPSLRHFLWSHCRLDGPMTPWACLHRADSHHRAWALRRGISSAVRGFLLRSMIQCLRFVEHPAKSHNNHCALKNFFDVNLQV